MQDQRKTIDTSSGFDTGFFERGGGGGGGGGSFNLSVHVHVSMNTHTYYHCCFE